MSVYVVIAPEHARGIYESWPACEAQVKGVAGARYQKARSSAEAEALLNGEAVRVPDGVFAFVDGNHQGGVGVVLVHRQGTRVITKEIRTTVAQLFPAGVPSPGDPTQPLIPAAALLAELRNIAGELAALYQALLAVKPGTTLTIVHDYAGLGGWMTGRWKAEHPSVRALLQCCREIATARQLTLTFRHQPGHQPDVTRRTSGSASTSGRTGWPRRRPQAEGRRGASRGPAPWLALNTLEPPAAFSRKVGRLADLPPPPAAAAHLPARPRLASRLPWRSPDKPMDLGLPSCATRRDTDTGGSHAATCEPGPLEPVVGTLCRRRRADR